MRGFAASVVAVALSSSIAATAHANGRIPEANQLTVNDADPDFLYLRVSFGVLLSHDRGKSFEWVCESAIGYTGTFDPPIAIAEGRVLLAGTFDGLAISPNTGCTWVRTAPIDKRFVVDEATFPGSPKDVVAITNNFVRNDDAGVSLYESLLARSSDGAKTWTIVGAPIDETLVVDTVDFAKSDTPRIYVTGRKFEPKAAAFLLASTNGGGSFVSHPIPLEADEPGAFIGAVDPTNADRVYVRTLKIGEAGVGAIGGRLLVTSDGGKTFTERWRGGPPLGLALSPDGKKIWIGADSGGLFAADTTTFTFTELQPFAVKCLTATSDRLYACSTEFSSGFVLGESTDDGATFAPILKLNQIRGPLACQSGTETAKCASEWPQLAKSLNIPLAPPDAGTTATPPSTTGCGCSTIGERTRGGALAFAMGSVFAAALLRRRRQR
ncbi:hypothetical protein BH09MYX1_BH09MYX1_59110 [soil metagenome]